MRAASCFLLLTLGLFFTPAALAKDALKSPDIFQKEPFLRLADKYADPASDFYNRKEAQRYYLRSYMFEFVNISEENACLTHFSTIPGSLVKNAIHRDALKTLRSLCGFSNQALFTMAENFEKGIAPFFEDRYIALSIYERIALRLVMMNGERTLEKATKEKINLLKSSTL